ncbi:hypothetical protein FACS1894167_14210 [Synergistales bacterium]|nr:hypothetical protein FACS1894167_14210 [Synergistales bacterium]
MTVQETRRFKLVEAINNGVHTYRSERFTKKPENDENSFEDQNIVEECATDDNFVIDAIRYAQDSLPFLDANDQLKWLSEIGFTHDELTYFEFPHFSSSPPKATLI